MIFDNQPTNNALLDEINSNKVAFRIEPMEKYLAENQFISAGKVHDILTRTPRQFLYDWMQESAEQKETEATLLGSALHTLILEPGEFQLRYIVYDTGNRPNPAMTMAAKVNQEWKADLEAEALITGKKIITQEQFEIISAQARQIKENEITADIFDQKAAIEVSIYTYMIVGNNKFYVKLRPDFVSLQRPFYLDIKRTKNASPEYSGFPRDAYKYGYDIKMAFYFDVIQTVFVDLLKFFAVPDLSQQFKHSLILAVENDPPHNICLYRIPEEVMEIGRYRYRAGMDRFAQCLESQVWPGYGIYSEDHGIVDLVLPPWAGKEIVI